MMISSKSKRSGVEPNRLSPTAFPLHCVREQSRKRVAAFALSLPARHQWRTFQIPRQRRAEQSEHRRSEIANVTLWQSRSPLELWTFEHRESSIDMPSGSCVRHRANTAEARAVNDVGWLGLIECDQVGVGEIRPAIHR